MSDLQLALIVLGVLAVAAVAIYNVWQERQFRRRSEQALPQSGDDALMPGSQNGARSTAADGVVRNRLTGGSGAQATRPAAAGLAASAGAGDDEQDPARDPAASSAAADPRREPHIGEALDVHHTVAGTEAGPSSRSHEVRPLAREPRRAEIRSNVASALEGPAGLWYPIVFRLPAVADASALAVIRSEVSGENHIADWIEPDMPATEIALGDDLGATIDRVLRIQAVDARGPASKAQFQQLLANAQRAADQVGGQATAPEPTAASETAASLHAFCISVDVSIGLNVAASNGGLAGTKLRGLIEAAGFHSLPDHSFVLRDEAGNTLCTLTEGDGGGLDPQVLRSQSVRAISLLLDVPRTPGTMAQFERTATLARHFAQALSGSVVDDSGRVLDEASMARIRAQLGAMVKAMRAQGIEPGESLARRIFG